jgi:hypothetical protein
MITCLDDVTTAVLAEIGRATDPRTRELFHLDRGRLR